MSATELVAGLQDGSISSRELLERYLQRIATYGPSLNAVVTVQSDRARAEADAADDAARRGESLGALHGLPMTVKDQFATAGMRTTFGTREQSRWIPDSDALPVARLRSAGAIIFGKTNMATAGIDVQTNNPVFGRTNNPWDLARSSGGSSGGSAVAIAAGLTGLELGGDIGGSIRTPAHYCGIYGHKPSYRVVADPPDPSRRPGFRAELDMATPGPLARSANDLELALDVIAGPEPSDAVGWRLTLPEPSKSCLTGYRIAAWLDDDDCPTEPDVLDALRGAITALRGEGVSVHEHARPNFRLGDAFRVYQQLLYATLCHGLPLAGSPFMSHLAPFAAFVPGDSQLARAARGGSSRHAQWIIANEVRQEFRNAWEEFFHNYDALLCPATPCVAIPHNDRFGDMIIFRKLDGASGARPYMDQLVWPGMVGMAYLPSTVAPIGCTPGGVPVGVQIVGPYLEDRTTIDIARRLEPIVGGFMAPPDFR